MSAVSFKKGLLANMPATKSAGTVYITTDERAMYLDVDASTRIRLGDFQEYATYEALKQNPNPSTTALYYITNINCLAKWDGSNFVQINMDTGATSIEVTGTGNAVTTATYDAATRKITLTKGTTFATPGDIDTKITALNLANTYYAKTAGEANAAAIAAMKQGATIVTFAGVESALGEKVNSADCGDIISHDVSEFDAAGAAATAKSEAIAAAEAYADGLDEAMDARMDAAESAIATLDGADTVTGSVKKQIKDAIAAEDALAQGYADAAESAAKAYTDELEGELADVAKSGTAADVAVVDEAGKLTATNVESAIAELIQMIDAGGSGSVVTVEKDVTQTGIAARYTIKQGGVAVTGGVIDIPKDMVVKSGSVVKDPAGQPAGTYLVLVLQNATEDKVYINVSDLIEYVTAGADTATGHVVVSADHKVQMNVIAGSIGATQLDSTTNAALAKAHEHSNKTVLDGITAAKVSAWDAAEQNAKDYADGLDSAMDARMDDVEGAIEVLNGDASTAGSVKKQVADAKAAVEAEITALEEGAVADNTAAIAELDSGKVDKVSGSSLVADTKVAGYDAHLANGDIHVTAAQKTAWTAKQDALVFNTAYDASTNKVATMADISDSQLAWIDF